ncbi:PREDICTED: cilia- and flagella-associated protein 36 [Nanorana parkeri]|uniref:cilia- and flagella-associated protein 36 n=1 Tax=Nanorana parkeri TaxID=125878 RepID=UPI0008544245|nr:PREDICTED: cilia- and flagella-associated protein 36 [Nanorana parkeri]
MAEDAEWVLDSVLAFLKCPLWTEPVTDFIEQRCSVFDDEEENKLSYTEIHNEYKELVEKLIQGHVNEIGINEEQFQEACSAPFAHSPEVKNMLQAVLAVEDFVTFKEMMVQKNIELQLQAIQIIQTRNGVLPECLQNGTDNISDLEQEEMRLLTEALRISREEYELEELRRKERNATSLIENPPKTSISSAVTTSQKAEIVYLESKKQPLKVEEHPYKSSATQMTELSSTEAAQAWVEQARKEAGIQGSVTNLTQVEKEQLRERAEYLKQRRAELLSRKLDSKRKTHIPKECKEKAPCPRPEMGEEEKKSLQRRKQLAEKLKEEVINK